ncbi:DinB family protein [Aquibium microcysteis]|uniref:DinB family protein n=1 Tax=Aquibium microcysteis TaxID=675281 RepID=UPI0030840EDB
MARNNRWSDDRPCRAVLSLQPGEFEAPRTSVFPAIAETLNHMLVVDQLHAMLAKPPRLDQFPLDFDRPVRRAEMVRPGMAERGG